MAHSNYPTLSDAAFLVLLEEAQAQAALRKKVQGMNAYLEKQEAIAGQISSLPLEDLRRAFEATADYDEAWEIACAIADEIGDEAAAPYFARVNALE